MNKNEIIQLAADNGIQVTETTYGIWNPEPVYSMQPVRGMSEGKYHVTLNRSRDELLSGIRLMAERMKREFKGLR